VEWQGGGGLALACCPKNAKMSGVGARGGAAGWWGPCVCPVAGEGNNLSKPPLRVREQGKHKAPASLPTAPYPYFAADHSSSWNFTMPTLFIPTTNAAPTPPDQSVPPPPASLQLIQLYLPAAPLSPPHLPAHPQPTMTHQSRLR
jgi:hypothetical protein